MRYSEIPKSIQGIFFALISLLLAACAQSASTSPPPTQEPAPTEVPVWYLEGWDLTWGDEFDGAAIDPENWVFDIGGDGWGNSEWQYYTDQTSNARLEDGFLVIEAKEESFSSRDYTSARLKTQALHAWTYGRFEARIQIPYGQGIWPAFWMLGEDIPQVGWPQSGEIDIMENIGREPATVHGTVHGPGYSGADGVGSGFNLTSGQFSEDFHVYAIEWEPEEIRWYVDDTLYHALTPDDVPGEWVYDHPFFIILNVAVGGAWPGYPDETTEFPQQMLVDYVRVYQTPELIEMATSTGGVLHVAGLDTGAQVVGESWQAEIFVTVVDENGQPIEGVTVEGGWLGLVRDGDTSLKTNSEGTAGPFLSKETDRSGEIDFCVRDLSKVRFDYAKDANVSTCMTIDYSLD